MHPAETEQAPPPAGAAVDTTAPTVAVNPTEDNGSQEWEVVPDSASQPGEPTEASPPAIPNDEEASAERTRVYPVAEPVFPAESNAPTHLPTHIALQPTVMPTNFPSPTAPPAPSHSFFHDATGGAAMMQQPVSALDNNQIDLMQRVLAILPHVPPQRIQEQLTVDPNATVHDLVDHFLAMSFGSLGPSSVGSSNSAGPTVAAILRDASAPPGATQIAPPPGAAQLPERQKYQSDQPVPPPYNLDRQTVSTNVAQPPLFPPNDAPQEQAPSGVEVEAEPECPICTEVVSPLQMIQLGCADRHTFCSNCILHYLQVQTEEDSATKCPIPGCDYMLTAEDVRGVCSNTGSWDMMEKWCRSMAVQTLHDMKDVVWCPNCGRPACGAPEAPTSSTTTTTTITNNNAAAAEPVENNSMNSEAEENTENLSRTNSSPPPVPSASLTGMAKYISHQFKPLTQSKQWHKISKDKHKAREGSGSPGAGSSSSQNQLQNESGEDSPVPPPPSEIIQCPGCSLQFCPVCLGPSHLNLTCYQVQVWRARQNVRDLTRKDNLSEEEQKMLAEHAMNEAWKMNNTLPCPQCKSPIEKKGGCRHMTCARCKHQFCWECLDPWKCNSQLCRKKMQQNRAAMVQSLWDENAQQEANEDAEWEHENIVCDKCLAFPVKGRCFCCITCTGCYYCADCEKSRLQNHNPQHVFMEIGPMAPPMPPPAPPVHTAATAGGAKPCIIM
eukprot:TRINITY_DN67895_c9_g4_i1.p1 TRINITY_DN67895_c9_g4~~TRINITY_DN67895_c9_g4_i1.p1  ORF type:complete len:724 (-),score=113.16 TRINITY_DN67895_c9_g4_i1:70-2241(-)